MPKLYNTQTRREEVLAEGDVQNAILSGTHSYLSGERVNVKDDLGEVVSVPAENLNAALQNGYNLETPSQSAVREYVEDNKGIKGTLKVGVGQFADELAFGLPELIYDRTGDPLEVAKKEALKKDHEFSNTVGGIAGFAAGTFVGAPIYKAATKAGEFAAKNVAERLLVKSGEQFGTRTAGRVAKDLVARMATSATKMGVENAVLSAPRAITETMLGDPEAAGETMLAGVGIGALFGAGGALAKDLGKLAKNKLSAAAAKGEFDTGKTWAEIFKDKADDKAVEALNPTLSQMERLENTKDPKRLGQFLREEGIVTPLASHKVMYERLADKTQTIGTEMGELVKRIDDIQAPQGMMTGGELADLIEAGVIVKNQDKIAYRPILGQIQSLAEEFRTIGSPLNLAGVREQRGAIDDLIANWGAEEKVKQRFIRETRNVIEGAVESRIGAISPDDLTRYKDLKVKYGYLEDAEKIARKSAAREAKNNDFGLTSFIAGTAGGAVAGIPGAIGAFVAREGARRYGNQVMAAMYDRASGILLAEQAMKRTAERIDRIPGILSRMSERLKPDGSAITSSAVLRLMTGDEQKKQSPEQRLENFTKKASIWANDPAKFSEKLAEIVSPVSDNGAPTIGQEFNRKLSDAFNYLWQELPRQNRPLNPFQKERIFRPTVQDMNAFEQKAKVVFDPFSVLDELENGTVTKHHTDALKVVYPRIYDMMRKKVYDAITKGVKPLSYAKRIKLSLLLDEPLDSSMRPDALKTLQSTFLIPEETPTQGGQKVDLATRYASESERLAAN